MDYLLFLIAAQEAPKLNRRWLEDEAPAHETRRQRKGVITYLRHMISRTRGQHPSTVACDDPSRSPR
jgi:hypothetical protein